jgi:hypothetical protein
MASSTALPREVADWNLKFQRCVTVRQEFEQQWYLNLAFFFGRQYAQWDHAGGISRLVEPAAPRNRVRSVSNKVRPAVRREITKLTKEEPQFYVKPNSTEPADIMGARVGESLADYIMDVSKYNNARRLATFWASTTGNGWTKTLCMGKDKPILFQAPTPFHMYAPYAQIVEVEDQPYIIEAKAVPCETMWHQYNVDVRPDVNVAEQSTLEQRFFKAMGISVENEKDMCFMKEIWVKPCRDYPDGALLVMADNKIVYAYEDLNRLSEERRVKEAAEREAAKERGEEYEEPPTPEVEYVDPNKRSKSEWPYEGAQLYPYDKIDHIPSGRFFATSFIEDLIPLQKEYNRSRSQLIESKNRTSKPAMAYYKGSIEANKVTSEPGLQIPVNPGFDLPQYLKQPDMPNYVLQEFPLIKEDMDDVTNQFEVAKGRTPPGVEAASAIAYLQEENDDILHGTIASLENAVASAGRKSLALVQQFWSDEKLISVVSRNATVEAMAFKISDLKDNTDLRIESQSMAPRSRAAKQAFITDLMKNQMIPVEKGLRYLQMSETDRLYEELQADSRHAQRENFKISQKLYQADPVLDPATNQPLVDQAGTPVLAPPSFPINEFDVDEVHIYEHGLWLKSQEYETADPEVQQVALAHYMLHKDRATMQMMMAQQAENPEEQQEGAVPTQ